MASPFLLRFSGRGWLTLALGLGLSLALTAVGWRDYVLARGELGSLVRAQATSVRDAVAAAARSNLTAADEMQQAFADRLLDNARLLAALDRRAPLTDADLSAVVGQNRLFRVVVVGADRSRTASAGGGAAFGHGPGGGNGPGRGMGPGGAGLVERLLQAGDQEAVTGVHTGRRDGAARLAAGVRLAGGGAIVVSVDASDVVQLQRQSGLGELLDDIVRHTGDVAYLVFEQRDVRLARGDVPPPDTFAPGEASAEQGMPAERERVVSGRPVLELTSPIDLGAGRRGSIVLGMRLDALRRAERRTLTRLATSLSAAAALGVLAIGLVWLTGRYGALSVEHARAQAALRRKDRLTAMGELASTVAHEIRNPLNAIVMSAQRLSREYFGTRAATPADEDARALLGVVASEAARIDDKVRQFLEFARPKGLLPRSTPLRDWIPPIADSLEALAASRGVTIVRGEIPDRSVVFDPDQVRQVLDNLLRNAIDATPPGGRVTLSAEWTPRHLVVEVRDTGSGITADVLPKIFDLYFTTKPQGTGIGLAVSQQIVVAHGGRIDAESRPGRGTVMRVVLPATTGPDHA